MFPPFDYLAVEYWRQRKVQALFWSESAQLDFAAIEALRCAVLHLETPNWHEAMMSFTKSGGYSDLASKISQTDKPTLILWGERDETLGTDDARKFHYCDRSFSTCLIKKLRSRPAARTTSSHCQILVRFSKKILMFKLLCF